MTAIQLHSITDLITNSSTVIFTYSGASVSACREMIDEIFKTCGVYKTCDDVFTLTVTLDDDYRYDESDHNPGIHDKDLDALLADIKSGKVEKPEWMAKTENEDGYLDYKPSTTLNIEAKLTAFESLANLVAKFLYSTGHEATRDG